MLGRGGYGKSPSKLQRLLRQDHSDVYFNNEKLNEELNNRIDNMQKDMHKHDIQRGIEIKKLKKEIYEAQWAHSKVTGHTDCQPGQLAIRPHTAVGYAPRQPTSGISGRKRAQSAWARTGSYGEEDNKVPDRPPSQDSSVSTLRDTKTLRKYRNIDASWFKENNRFPEEWYVKCLPASDAAIHNARKKPRSKSAHASFGFLAKIREKEMTERKLQQFTKRNKKLHSQTSKTTDRDTYSADIDHDRLSLICEEPVKPILMSRRRLMEITNVDTYVERGPSRNTERHIRALDFNRLENTRLENKVREFCKELEEVKAREIIAMKEREEARRREAQEQEYVKAVDANLELTDTDNNREQT